MDRRSSYDTKIWLPYDSVNEQVNPREILEKANEGSYSLHQANFRLGVMLLIGFPKSSVVAKQALVLQTEHSKNLRRYHNGLGHDVSVAERYVNKLADAYSWPIPTGEFLKADEAAQILGVRRNTINASARRGELDYEEVIIEGRVKPEGLFLVPAVERIHFPDKTWRFVIDPRASWDGLLRSVVFDRCIV